jgi:hypothetical protein
MGPLTGNCVAPADTAVTVATDANNVTTYTYANQLTDVASVEQAFAFHSQQATASFGGLGFTIDASSVKWSIQIFSNSSSSLPTNTAGLTIRYSLSGLLFTNGTITLSSSSAGITTQSNSPRANMTTYLLPLFSTSTSTSSNTTIIAQVEVFDVVLVDGTTLVSLNHSITAPSSSSSTFVLELQFPSFNQSLLYDPSLSLGTLLGADSGRSGGGGGGDNVGLIVGVAVAVPVAVAVVVAVIVAALVVAWWRRRQLGSGSTAVNFAGRQDDGEEL